MSSPPTASVPQGGDGPLAEGARLADKYRIERLIGKGGMGAVYLAEHELLSQPVAVKVVLSDRHAGGARLLNEARAAAKIRSEHVVRILDVGILEEKRVFLVMELLKGSDLASLLRREGPRPMEQIADWMLQALEAIAEAHAMGIVHRDLKPSNLFLSTRPNGISQIKVLDFGVATIVDGAMPSLERITASGSWLGSPAYSAPEALRGGLADARSDIWSLGVVVYELLSGALPFEGATVPELCAAILENRRVPLRSRVAAVPEVVERIIARCLEPQPGQRYASAAQLARALGPLAPPERASYLDRIASAELAHDRRFHSDDIHAPELTKTTDESWNTEGLEPREQPRNVRRRSRRVALALGAVSLGLVGAALVARSTTRGGRSEPRAAGEQPFPAVTSASPAATMPATASAELPAPAIAPTPIASARSASAPPKPAARASASAPARNDNAPAPAQSAPSRLKVLEDRL